MTESKVFRVAELAARDVVEILVRQHADYPDNRRVVIDDAPSGLFRSASRNIEGKRRLTKGGQR
jgi:hypothetical protein